MKNEKTVIEKRITYQESDHKGHYRLSNLISVLSDLATLNALEIQIWDTALDGQYGWILTKQTLRLHRPIESGETISLSTQAGKASRIQFTRLYDFYDENESVVGGGYSAWTFIDLQRRRIVRPDKVGIVIPEITEHTHTVNDYVAIEKEMEMEEMGRRKVSYSDIDVNLHMNNSRYIEWALDVMDISIFDTYYISEVSMLYKKEMAPETEAIILSGKKDEYFKVQLVSLDKDIVYFELGGRLTPIS